MSSWYERYSKSIKKAGIFDDTPEKDYGTPEELAEARSVGVSRLMYNHLRSPNPEEHPTEYSYETTKSFIPTHKNIIEMGKADIDPFDYNAANGYGLHHEEIMEIHGKGINVGDYVEARKHGLTYGETMSSKNLKNDIQKRFKDLSDAHNHGIDLDDYTHVRNYGATHEDVLDAHKKKINLHNYAFARNYGATHEDVLDAHKKKINLHNYAFARNQSTHEETLDAHKKEIPLEDYSYFRISGATHEEALDAQKQGVDCLDYTKLRNRGATHKEALEIYGKRKIHKEAKESLTRATSWGRRYAMAKDDTITSLFGKIKDNANRYFANSGDAPHQWISRYLMTARERGSDNHEALSKACYQNSDEAGDMAVNRHKMFFSHKRMWYELGNLHSEERRKSQ